MSDNMNEIQEVLMNQGEVELETIEDEFSSPLNEPVVNVEDYSPNVQKKEENSSQRSNNWEEAYLGDELGSEFEASEQEINEGFDFDEEINDTQEFELPTNQAKQMAKASLGVVNNFLGIGAGLFVKIKKHEEFYEFEEVIQVIDQQNEKNINRVKLDKEDKELLIPLLVPILKKKAQELTPEQQLIIASLSILAKKAQTVVEIKQENDILTQRILNIIREEKEEEQEIVNESHYSDEENQSSNMKVSNESESNENQVIESSEANLSPNQIMEVADDHKK